MNNITVIKENTDTIQLKLYNNGSQYQLDSNDYIIFTVRKDVNDEEYLIRRRINPSDYDEDNRYYPIPILSTDTQNVEIGNHQDYAYYKYDVTLYNTVDTIFQKTLYRGDFLVGWRASKGSDA